MDRIGGSTVRGGGSVGVRGDQRRRRQDGEALCGCARPQGHSRQRRSARRGRDRNVELYENGGGTRSSAGYASHQAHWTAGRHRWGRGFSRFGGGEVAHRRHDPCRWGREALKRDSICALKASTKSCSAGPALSRSGFAAATTISFASVPRVSSLRAKICFMSVLPVYLSQR